MKDYDKSRNAMKTPRPAMMKTFHKFVEKSDTPSQTQYSHFYKMLQSSKSTGGLHKRKNNKSLLQDIILNNSSEEKGKKFDIDEYFA